MYQRKGKVQNIVMLAVNDYQGCAPEVPGCHRLLTLPQGDWKNLHLSYTVSVSAGHLEFMVSNLNWAPRNFS